MTVLLQSELQVVESKLQVAEMGELAEIQRSPW